MPPPQLSLKHFILQARARNLYRQALRAARRESCSCGNVCQLTILLDIPDQGARKETIHWIRSDFDRHRFLTDIVREVLLVREG